MCPWSCSADTQVVEVEAMEHRESVRHDFAIRLLDDLMLQLVDEIMYPTRDVPFFPQASEAASARLRDEL